jgi:Ankyrin repeat
VSFMSLKIESPGTAAPPNSRSEPSRPDLDKDFAEAVKRLPDSAQLKLTAYSDGTPNEKAREAIRCHDLEALSLLLYAGLDVDAHTIRYAFNQKDFAALRLLCSRGVDLQSVACNAIAQGKFREVVSILELGVKPTAAMLGCAIDNNRRKITRLLLDKGVDPNALLADCHEMDVRKFTPYLRLFFHHGADFNTLSKDGTSLLHRACRDHDLECVTELIRCGANVNLPSGDGVPPVHMVWHLDNRGTEPVKQQAAVIRFLCKNGADPAAPIRGLHPLSFTPARNEILVCLLAHGMVRNWAAWGGAAISQNSAMIVRSMLDWAISSEQGKLFNDCVRALVPFLKCQREDVRDNCAAWLAKAMHEYDWAVPEETHEMAHEGLGVYLEQLEGDPPLKVKLYAAKHNFPDLLLAEEAKLSAAGLTLHGIDKDHRRGSKSFTVIGYIVRTHALMLVDYARIWAENPEAPVEHATAILRFVNASLGVLDLTDAGDLALKQSIIDAVKTLSDDARALRYPLYRPQ